jgi:hypothetical protein
LLWPFAPVLALRLGLRFSGLFAALGNIGVMRQTL